jgi:hypothetical protein
MSPSLNCSSNKTSSSKQYHHLYILVAACTILLVFLFEAVSKDDSGGLQQSQQMRRVLKERENDAPKPSYRALQEQQSDVAVPVIEEEVTKKAVVPPNRKLTKLWYSVAFSDRSGSAINDMLYAHAYAFHQNTTYGGACAMGYNKRARERQSQHIKMIESLGLSHVLRFGCPKNRTETALIHSREYHKYRGRVWNKDWVEYIRSQQKHEFPQNNSEKVVVHIRRGDVQLCKKKVQGRYLPNSHYLRLIQKHFPDVPKDQVTIFSEKPYWAEKNPPIEEPWDDFDGYNLRFDGSPTDVWKAAVAADGYIMSKSMFSLIPAIFNRNGTVVFTPFMFPSLPGWKRIDKKMKHNAFSDAKSLRRKLCNVQKVVNRNQ